MVDLVTTPVTRERTAVDVVVSRSEDWGDVLPILDPDSGAPADITGYAVDVWIRVTPGGNLIAHLSSLGGEIAIADAAGGLIAISMPVLAVRAQLPAGAWCWHGVLSSPAERVEFLRGACTVVDGPIHAAGGELVASSLNFELPRNSILLGI